jgi:hypothetical protein
MRAKSGKPDLRGPSARSAQRYIILTDVPS